MNARPVVQMQPYLLGWWEVRCPCGYAALFGGEMPRLEALNDGADHARFDCPLQVVNARPKVWRCGCEECARSVARWWCALCPCGYDFAESDRLDALDHAATHARFDCPLNTDDTP